MINNSVSKKILVTGSRGFIGNHLINKLKEFDIQTDFVNNNRIDLQNISQVLNLEPADFVIHLASKIPESGKNNPSYFFKNNISSTLNILEYCIKKQIKKLIYVGSYPYGIPNDIPISEEHRINPHTPYSESKYVCEQLCKSYSNYYGLNVIVLRPFNIYGKFQKLDFLIPNLINAIKTEKKISITNKKSKRDFLFIDDFTNAICKLLELDTKFEIFNIGSGQSHSFEDIIKMIEDLTGKSFSIDAHDDEKTYIADITADISKISKYIDWKPSISLKNGLKKML